MLTKPRISDREIIRCLRAAYGLRVNTLSFLPLGADFNTAVYRVVVGQEDYFLKLRKGAFFDATVTVPKYLNAIGLRQVIAPLITNSGQLWTHLGAFKVTLYPYVEGRNGVEAKLSDQQWMEFGAVIKKLHSADIPQAVTKGIPQEVFSSKWSKVVKESLMHIENRTFIDPVSVNMALFLQSKRELIFRLVRRTEQLAYLLQKQSLHHVLCHADIHGWNLLIDKDDALYLVDWDTLIFAPPERDLMFIGAGIHETGRTPLEEELLFYQGYGQLEVNQDAVAYYRYARIIEDIGSYCQQIFLSDESNEDRVQSFEYLQANFLPNGTIERACQSDMEIGS